MPDSLYQVGWNQLLAVGMAAIVWLVCRTPWLRRRPALCHGLWLLVLLKLITPPFVPVTVLPAGVVSKAAATATTVPCADCASMTPSLAGHRFQMSTSGASLNPASPDTSRTGSTLAGCEPPTTPASGVSSPTIAEVSSSPLAAVSLAETGASTWRKAFIVLLAASLFVTGALWMIAARRVSQLRRLLGGRAVESGRAAKLLREVSRLFQLRRVVNLRIVEAPVTPMLWAVPGRPAIVLPRELIESLDDDGLRNIIAHELAHYVRRDHWSNLFTMSLATLLWWHPVVWMARREVSAAAEASCDALALERLGSRRSYAATLLTVVDSLTTTNAPRAALAITFGQSHSLRRRFEMIADANVKPRMTWGGWALLALGLAPLALAPARAEEEAVEAKAAHLAAGFKVQGKATPSLLAGSFCCPEPVKKQDESAGAGPSETESTAADSPSTTTAEGDINWDEARDGWQVGAQLLSSSHQVDPGDPIVLQFLLRNVTDQEQTIDLHAYGPIFHTLTAKNQISLHISPAQQKWRHAIGAGEILRSRRYRIALDTRGLPPGTYTITRLTPFWTPGDEANVNKGLSFRASVSVTIGSPSVVNRSEPPEVEGEPKIYWGDPVAGIVIGLQLPDGQSVWSDHAEIESQVYAVNVTDQPIQLEYEIPSDDWEQHVETEDEKHVRLRLIKRSGWRTPITRKVTLQPREVIPITGIEAEVTIGPEIDPKGKSATRKITGPQLRIRPKGTEYKRSDAPALLTDKGEYRWFVSVSATRSRIPDLSLFLTTGGAPLMVK